MNISPEEIARLRALEAKATPGPWVYASCGGDPYIEGPVSDGHDYATNTVAESGYTDNCFLIVAARNTLPRLLDEIERLRDELDFQKRLRVPCECSADDACKFARERDEARADLAVMTGYRDSLARRIQELKDARSSEEYRADVAEDDLREAVALLRLWAEEEVGVMSDDRYARRAALLAKQKEMP